MKVSVNILTKNRKHLLIKALDSIIAQSFQDYEIVVINDGSTDDTQSFLNNFQKKNLRIISHPESLGITRSRQEALLASSGDYVTILDDDDQWFDPDKLKKQVEFLDTHGDYALVGGGITISKHKKFRPQSDRQIRQTMLFRNNFFTSTVMFRREAAITAGGFIISGSDLAEDYDLWLRLGKIGKMYNFQQAFAAYRAPDYNKDKRLTFFSKQLALIQREKFSYGYFWLASLILKFRMTYGF